MTNGEKFKEVFGFGADGSRVIAVNKTWWDCDFQNSKPITNADRIRSMSDEELAKKISGIESFALTCGGGWPPEKWLDWLRQEANDKPV